MRCAKEHIIPILRINVKRRFGSPSDYPHLIDESRLLTYPAHARSNEIPIADGPVYVPTAGPICAISGSLPSGSSGFS